ncbi:MAG: GxxExxY protein [Flavisolibacter sp.]|jgi:GxxExxY protein
MIKEQYEWLAKEIFRSSLEVHKNLGPGLLESVYECALIKELSLRNINVSYQIQIPLIYKGYDTGKYFFIDVLVEKEIIVEIKSVEKLAPVHEAQLLSYMKLSNKSLGFLINFNEVLLKDGFKRKVNNYKED